MRSLILAPVLAAVAPLAILACSGGSDVVASPEESEAVANYEPPVPVGGDATENVDDKGPDGATAVVRAYFDAVRDGRSAEAYRLWADDGKRTGLDPVAFADHVKTLKDIDVAVGEPGMIEGAAGSLYIQVPVQTSGVGPDGKPFDADGIVTLRRVNDVDGAEERDLFWHIDQSTLPTRP